MAKIKSYWEVKFLLKSNLNLQKESCQVKWCEISEMKAIIQIHLYCIILKLDA